MSLHRPSSLMGLAAGHEAGERRPSPIAPGAGPLTAEERAAIRKRHERAANLERMYSDPVAFAKEALGVALQPCQEEMLEAFKRGRVYVPSSEEMARAAGLTRWPNQYGPGALAGANAEGLRAIKDRLERVHVGIDTAKPGIDTTVAALVSRDEHGNQKVEPVSAQELYQRDIWNRY